MALLYGLGLVDKDMDGNHGQRWKSGSISSFLYTFILRREQRRDTFIV